jgi:hypothetical protein
MMIELSAFRDRAHQMEPVVAEAATAQSGYYVVVIM